MADVNIDPESTDSKQLFNQGVKAFVLRDYKNAVDALGRATELMVTELGDDLHDSLGDAYLYYGKALLSLYRQESDPIGTLPKELPTAEDQEPEEDEDEEADNEENEEKAEAGANGDAAEEGKKENGTQNGDETKDEKVDGDDEEDCLKLDEADESTTEKDAADKSATEKDAANGGATEKDAANKKGKEKKIEDLLELDPVEPEADEEPTDLQVAWEVLELAKKIFHNRGEEGRKAYADTLVTLAEISQESENYEAAINDFREGLEIQIQIYPEDSRKVAETFYNIGVTFASNSSYREGIAHLRKSIEYLERRIRNLEDKKENLDEVQEMKDLIPEIYEKIRDLQSFTDETIKQLDELTKQPDLASKILDGAGCSSSKQASDISHLVKRKRKAEENDEECNPPKKCPQ